MGMDGYMEYVTRRYELENQILQGIREGNQYQALQAFHRRAEIKAPGRLENELIEWKYDLLRLLSTMLQELHRIRGVDFLLEGVYTEFVQRLHRAVYVEECKRLTEEMLVRLCSMHPLRTMQEYSFLVQKIILEVDLDLSRMLTLQYFSQKLNVNSSYLSHLFRREMGMTITDYVTQRRLNRAADLLLTTQDPVKLIAKQVGITDVHYFSRLFKKKMGKPPLQYRAECG